MPTPGCEVWGTRPVLPSGKAQLRRQGCHKCSTNNLRCGTGCRDAQACHSARHVHPSTGFSNSGACCGSQLLWRRKSRLQRHLRAGAAGGAQDLNARLSDLCWQVAWRLCCCCSWPARCCCPASWHRRVKRALARPDVTRESAEGEGPVNTRSNSSAVLQGSRYLPCCVRVRAGTDARHFLREQHAEALFQQQ